MKLRIGTEMFSGSVAVIADRATIEHVTDLLAAKYWYTWPYVALARLLGSTDNYDSSPGALVVRSGSCR